MLINFASNLGLFILGRLFEVQVGKVARIRLGRPLRLDLLLGGVEDIALLVQVLLFLVPDTVVGVRNSGDVVESNWLLAPLLVLIQILVLLWLLSLGRLGRRVILSFDRPEFGLVQLGDELKDLNQSEE